MERPAVGWYVAAYGLVVVLALALRLWDLGGRPMHYDESLHASYTWQLFSGEGFRHEPWIHGPLQFFLNSVVFGIFWDSDYTVRVTYALFGSALVALPYFLRSHLGRAAALIAAVMLALSPALFYFSRYSRNDIYMAFWALALFILMWRYINEGKNRYLYMTAAVLALAFATKETAYIIVAIFGLLLLLLSVTDVVPWLTRRISLSDFSAPASFLLLMGTLTLPQWAALVSVFQGSGEEGLVLASTTATGGVPVGVPLWAEPFVNVGLINLPGFLDGIVLAAIASLGIYGVFAFRRTPSRAAVVAGAAALAAVVYAALAFINMEVAVNYLVAGAVLLAVSILAAALGLMWRWRVWLTCAAIFYGIWLTFYTSIFSLFGKPFTECPETIDGVVGTVCSRFGGAFTGVWQSLGYWMAQQEVSRGNQPWFYYLLIGSVYEFLPLLLGLIGVIYFLRKGGFLGLFLIFWACATFMAYTVAGEKMPWLLVNIIVPFIILAAKLIGNLVEGLPWRKLLRSPSLSLLLIAPLFLAALVYLTGRFLNDGTIESALDWVVFAAATLLSMAFVFVLSLNRPAVGLGLGALGVMALLLGFTAFSALRASYTNDDQPVEMLVYAGASEDVRQLAIDLREQPFLQDPGEQVLVDYEIWYPFNWYVRKDAYIAYRCYKDEKEREYYEGCSPIQETPTAKGLVLLAHHGSRDSQYLHGYEQNGPFKDLIWFPETYRREEEDRQNETFWQEFPRDLAMAGDRLSDSRTWRDAYNYILGRRLTEDWWDSNFFTYLPKAP